MSTARSTSKSKSSGKPSSRVALEEALAAPARPLGAPAASKRPRGTAGGRSEDNELLVEGNKALISSKQSRRVLDEARAQLAEIAAEEAGLGDDDGGRKRRRLPAAAAAAVATASAGAGSISAALRGGTSASSRPRVPAPLRRQGTAFDSDDDEEDEDDDDDVAADDDDVASDADDEIIDFGEEDGAPFAFVARTCASADNFLLPTLFFFFSQPH